MYLSILGKINIVDNYILLIIKKYLKNKYLDILMPLITNMGNMGVIWIIITIALSLDKQLGMILGIVILTLIISTVIGEGIIKNVVRRVRPCSKRSSGNLLISRPLSYSFPSGHTLSSFAAAEVLSLYFTQYKIIFIIIAFLIALSRLYLYVHYPTDVIAGVIMGLLCSKLVLIIVQEEYIQKFLVLCKNK